MTKTIKVALAGSLNIALTLAMFLTVTQADGSSDKSHSKDSSNLP